MRALCQRFLEAALVPHCGESTEGFYLNTLSTVDVATGWSECVGVWGKGQERVGGAVHRVRQRLPFPLLGLGSDNGASLLTNTSMPTVSGRRLLSPAPALTRRTIAVM